MSLSGALQIGKSGLLAHQSAIELTGNNLTNMATEGYHRQRIHVSPARDHQDGNLMLGRGVNIDAVSRQIDIVLEERLRDGMASQAGAEARTKILESIEAIQDGLSDQDLSSNITRFFNSWSNLANSPGDDASRSVVLNEGVELADKINQIRSELVDLRNRTDTDLDQSVVAANDLLQKIEDINKQIMSAEGGQGSAELNGAFNLRDQRDQLLTELSEMIEINTAEHPNGAVDIYVGSTPIMLNGFSRDIAVRRDSVQNSDGTTSLVIDIVTADDQSPLATTSGSLLEKAQARENDIVDAIDNLDEFASHLIFEVNKIYSQGQAEQGFTSLLGTEDLTDPTLALSDTTNGLENIPTHGSFKVHLTQKSTGLRTSTEISVDLDGIGVDSTLNDIVAALNGVGQLSASLTADNRVQLDTSGIDFELSFSDDTSGFLASMGLNTFFTGQDAADIAVNEVIVQDNRYLAIGRNHVQGDNANAVAIADLNSTSLDTLGGKTLSDTWQTQVENIATKLSQSRTRAEGDRLVVESLQTQQQTLSGVNTDEEAINLLTYQRGYQGSARFLSVVDEMMQTILSVI